MYLPGTHVFPEALFVRACWPVEDSNPQYRGPVLLAQYLLMSKNTSFFGLLIGSFNLYRYVDCSFGYTYKLTCEMFSLPLSCTYPVSIGYYVFSFISRSTMWNIMVGRDSGFCLVQDTKSFYCLGGPDLIITC